MEIKGNNYLVKYDGICYELIYTLKKSPVKKYFYNFLYVIKEINKIFKEDNLKEYLTCIEMSKIPQNFIINHVDI